MTRAGLTQDVGIKRWFGTGFKSTEEMELEEEERYRVYNEELRIRGEEPVVREERKDKEKV